MMKAVMAGLLAAATLVPAMAMAQDVSVREAFRQRMEARGQLPRADAPRTDVSRTGADRQGGGWQRPDRPRRQPEAQGGGWQRPDDRRDRATADRWQRPDGTRDDRRDRRDVPAGGWRGERRDPRGQANGRDWRAERGWNGNGWNGNGRDRQDRGTRDWSWNDRGGWDDRWDRGGQRQWNRDWRRDTRYDWNRYRTVNRGAYRLPRYDAPYGWNGGYRRFAIGAALSSILFAPDYWIADPFSYRLPDAYGPYRWVRYYDDALLVDLDTGRVVDVVTGMFW